MKDQSGLYKNRPAAKFIPGKPSDPSQGDDSGSKNTERRDLGGFSEHDFNYKAKVTNQGGNFHDFGNRQAGLKFNGAEKDASLDHMKERNQKGQRIVNYSGGNEVSRLHTGNGGVTAYNSMPIKEVYTPATSNRVAPANAVVHTAIKKEESQAPSNQTKLGKQVRDSGK